MDTFLILFVNSMVCSTVQFVSTVLYQRARSSPSLVGAGKKERGLEIMLPLLADHTFSMSSVLSVRAVNVDVGDDGRIFIS